MDDPTMLVLVLDDPLAPGVLGAWKALAPALEERRDVIPQIARLARALPCAAEATLDRCRLAGLLRDGGISPTGEQWLRSIVAARLGATKTKR